jgi:hypothetical protein
MLSKKYHRREKSELSINFARGFIKACGGGQKIRVSILKICLNNSPSRQAISGNYREGLSIVD